MDRVERVALLGDRVASASGTCVHPRACLSATVRRTVPRVVTGVCPAVPVSGVESCVEAGECTVMRESHCRGHICNYDSESHAITHWPLD